MIASGLWRDVRAYREEIRRVRAISSSYCTSWWTLLNEFGKWRELQQPGRNPLDDKLPWITLGAINYLSSILTGNDRVFEWGSGGSTLYLLDKVKELITVEHDPEWFQRVQAKVDQNRGRSNWSGRLILPTRSRELGPRDESLWSDYFSSDARFPDMSFEDYSRAIDQYPDDTFQLVLVDGRARPSCIHLAIPKVAPGGTLMLDNAEREYYQTTCDEMRSTGWTLREFYGPGSYVDFFWNTQFWQKPRASSEGRKS